MQEFFFFRKSDLCQHEEWDPIIIKRSQRGAKRAIIEFILKQRPCRFKNNKAVQLE